jgi:hypothetical protein
VSFVWHGICFFHQAMDFSADILGPALLSQKAAGGDPAASAEASFSRVIAGSNGYGPLEGLGRAKPVSAALSLVGLTRLMEESKGDPAISVGIIDGPLDLEHPAFATASLRTVKPGQLAVCREARSVACTHGTAIAGILCAERGSPAPAICSACSFLLYPIFPADDGAASVTPAELARAIVETVDAGARIINLSLAVIPADTTVDRELDGACDYAAKHGAILVAAAGNQGRIGFLPLLNHQWVIPTVSCDFAGRVTPESNLSPTIGARGLCAPGVDILTAAPGGNYAPISGTSAAAAIVTGSMALLWATSPATAAPDLRAAVLGPTARKRRSLVPPLLDLDAARKRWPTSITGRENDMSEGTTQGEIHQAPAADEPNAILVQASARGPGVSLSPMRRRVTLSQAAPCPTCAAAEGQNSGPPTYIFAIGQARMRFPSTSVEKEFAQVTAAEGTGTARLTDQAVLHRALEENRYLANEVCWVFTIDSVETYILVGRDNVVLDQFVAAVRPSERGLDTDVIIGTQGPMAPPEMCNGLVAPIVLVDRIYSFQKPELLSALKAPAESEMTDDELQRSADELFERIKQVADNVGATDEHRAMNYLAVRYPQIYTHTAEMFSRNFSLTRVEVLPSRLAGTRKLVNVVLTYTNRTTDVEEKYRARVDVTEKFPFLERRLSPYFDRE